MTPSGKLRLLGTFEFAVDEQPITTFRSDKVRALFAWLAVEHDRTHQRSLPAGLLWGDYLEKMALKNLRMSLSNLKKLLSDAGLQDVFVVTRSQVQVLVNQLLTCDVVTLNAHLAAARIDSAENHALPSETIAHLESAVALYRGEFLAGLSVSGADAFEQWRSIQREQLHGKVERALEALVRDGQSRQDDARIQQYANRLIALTPWHESAHFALMQSFARSGLRSEALTQFETCQSVLWEELGVEPSDELIAYYEALAAGKIEPALDPVPVVPAVRHNLPRVLPPFFGRNAERSQIASLIRDPAYPLVTIIGEGGLGKTHLALHVGRDLLEEMTDGVWLVSLEHLESKEGPELTLDLLQAIERAFGLEHSSSGPPLDALCAWLANKRLLLILDNLEQLLGDATLATLLSSLLNRLPGMTMLTTSRAPVRLRAEHVYRLRGLPVPSSAESATGRSTIQLFSERAQRASGYELSDKDLTQVVEICRLVEGNPLAIELAAGWTSHIAIGDIAATLRGALDALYTDAVDVPERHRSLEAVFDYSWHLLSSVEQKAMARLSIFADGFSAEAAQAVAQVDRRSLSTLVDKSLLRIEIMPSGSNRYVIPVVLRAPCSNRLYADEALRVGAEAAHADYFATLLATRQDDIRFNRVPARTQQVAEELANIRMAWRWLISAEAWLRVSQFAPPLFNLFDMRSRYRAGLEAFETLNRAVLQLPDQHALQAFASARAGWFSFLLGEPKKARTLLQNSLSLIDEGPSSVFGYNYFGAVLMHGAAFDDAKAQVSTALSHAQDTPDMLGQIIARNLLGRIAYFQNDMATARDQITASLALARKIEHVWSISFSLEYLAQIALERDAFAEATRLLNECRAIRETLDDKRGQAVCLRMQGDIEAANQQNDAALAQFGEAYKLFDAIGNSRGMLEMDARRGALQLAAGDTAAARASLMQLLSAGPAVVNEATLLGALVNIAQLYHVEGNAVNAGALASWLDQQTLSDRQRDAISSIARSELLRFEGMNSAEVAALLW